MNRFFLLVLPLLTACRDVSEDSAASGDGSGNGPHTHVTAEVSEHISLVIRVDWATDVPANSVLEFGETEELGTRVNASSENGTEHTALMLGLLADTEYHYRVVSEIDGEEFSSEIKSIYTGGLPPELPAFEWSGDADSVDDFVLLPLMGANWALAVLDGQARYRWYYIPEDQTLKTIRVRLARDGRSVLYNAIGQNQEAHDTPGSVMRVSFDGSELTTLNNELIPNMHHDFCELTDGSIAALSFDEESIGDTQLVSDRIVEIRPDGSYEVVFDTVSHFDPLNDDVEITNVWWTHGNALSCDLDANVYYYGMRNFNSILKIDRDTGEPVWGLGGTANDFDFVDDSQGFTNQHNFHVLEDSILVFSNEEQGVPSQVLEYGFNEDTLEATEIWSYMRDPPIDVSILGDASRMDSGITHINWAMRGLLERVTPEGESIWEASVELSHAFGYSTVIDGLYPGTD